ncbi:MAG: ABC transporter permease [Planctomycetes bacterium]|nr:ABC transporter permease [Planctomycetota bacterium]
MRALVIARRELLAAFDSPVAYLVLALVPALTAAFFFVLGGFFQQGVATLRDWFAFLPLLLIPVAPALTMRLWSEEFRSGTEELLATYPFRLRDLVLGKFLGAWGLLAVALGFTLGAPLTVAQLGDLDWGPVLGGYLGALLLGGACIAVGAFFSSCTRNQVVAWLLGVVVLLGFNLLAPAATAAAMPERLGRVLWSLDFGRRFADIARGVIALEDVVFYGVVTALFLCLNGLRLEARRWR